jgi:hypothetical protein
LGLREPATLDGTENKAQTDSFCTKQYLAIYFLFQNNGIIKIQKGGPYMDSKRNSNNLFVSNSMEEIDIT